MSSHEILPTETDPEPCLLTSIHSEPQAGADPGSGAASTQNYAGLIACLETLTGDPITMLILEANAKGTTALITFLSGQTLVERTTHTISQPLWERALSEPSSRDLRRSLGQELTAIFWEALMLSPSFSLLYTLGSVRFKSFALPPAAGS